MIFVSVLFFVLYFVVVGMLFAGFTYYIEKKNETNVDFSDNMIALLVALLWPVSLPIIGGSIIAYELIMYFAIEEEKEVVSINVTSQEDEMI
jgi:hypothetical protein